MPSLRLCTWDGTYAKVHVSLLVTCRVASLIAEDALSVAMYVVHHFSSFVSACGRTLPVIQSFLRELEISK
eukprot:scaffold260854_cov31-Tisochrysis_lutea.AAC.3